MAWQYLLPEFMRRLPVSVAIQILRISPGILDETRQKKKRKNLRFFFFFYNLFLSFLTKRKLPSAPSASPAPCDGAVAVAAAAVRVVKESSSAPDEEAELAPAPAELEEAFMVLLAGLFVAYTVPACQALQDGPLRHLAHHGTTSTGESDDRVGSNFLFLITIRYWSLS